MHEAIEHYDQAWNAPEADARRWLLAAALSDDCELLEPSGCFVGREAIAERVGLFADRFPGARVQITTPVDAHHNVARYGWEIRDGRGELVLGGIDVVEMDAEGRLQRIVMFFGD